MHDVCKAVELAAARIATGERFTCDRFLGWFYNELVMKPDEPSEEEEQGALGVLGTSGPGYTRPRDLPQMGTSVPLDDSDGGALDTWSELSPRRSPPKVSKLRMGMQRWPLSLCPARIDPKGLSRLQAKYESGEPVESDPSEAQEKDVHEWSPATVELNPVAEEKDKANVAIDLKSSKPDDFRIHPRDLESKDESQGLSNTSKILGSIAVLLLVAGLALIAMMVVQMQTEDDGSGASQGTTVWAHVTLNKQFTAELADENSGEYLHFMRTRFPADVSTAAGITSERVYAHRIITTRRSETTSVEFSIADHTTVSASAAIATLTTLIESGSLLIDGSLATQIAIVSAQSTGAPTPAPTAAPVVISSAIVLDDVDPSAFNNDPSAQEAMKMSIVDSLDTVTSAEQVVNLVAEASRRASAAKISFDLVLPVVAASDNEPSDGSADDTNDTSNPQTLMSRIVSQLETAVTTNTLATRIAARAPRGSFLKRVRVNKAASTTRIRATRFHTRAPTSSPPTRAAYTPPMRIDWVAGFTDRSARAATAQAGTKLKFMWRGPHNVYLLPNARAFKECDFSNAINLGSRTPVVFTIPAAQQRRLYFACEVGTHCQMGQKLNVKVTKGVATGAPVGLPTGAPTTPPPSAAPTPRPTISWFTTGKAVTGNCSNTQGIHQFLSAQEMQDQPAGFPRAIPLPLGSAQISLPQSASDTLLTLLWVKGDHCSTTLPVARSYAGYIWEGVMPAPLYPVCVESSRSCVIDFNSAAVIKQFTNNTGVFMIQTQRRAGRSVSQRESFARLMMQGTFGETNAGIDSALEAFGTGVENGGKASNDTDVSVAAAWLAAEMQKPPTYLRQRYRVNTNPRMHPDGDYNEGEEYGRCEVGSRWHMYAFNYWDKGRLIDMKASPLGVFQLFIDGVLRTEVSTFLTYTWSAGHADKQFYLCGVEPTSDPSQNRAIHVYPTAEQGATCASYNYFYKGHKGVNPVIHFIVPRNETTQVYNPGEVEVAAVKSSKGPLSGDYYMKSRSSGASCIEPGVKSGVTFMGIRNAHTGVVTYYKFESRMKFVENTITNPSKVESYAAGPNGVCPLTPKTFVNDGTCVQRRKNICTPLLFATGTTIKLDRETLRKFYLVSQKYVYVIKGLRLMDSTSDKFHKRSPCRKGYIDSVRTPEGRARFIRTNGSCPVGSRRLPTDGTEGVILAALRNETGHDIRDIAAWRFKEANGGVCSTSEDAIGASVDLDGDCWTHSHPHERNVYDCTYWVMAHGGNLDARNGGRRNPIAKWAMNGHHELNFPSFHPQSRWDWSNMFWDQRKFSLLGKWGDVVDFSALPTRLQTKEMAQALGGPLLLDNNFTFESCGSRGEVVNNPSRGHNYLFGGFTTGREQGLDRNYHYWADGPSNLWQNVVLSASDQLRQRVAWALNQFIVAVPPDQYQPEQAAVFYDIFLRYGFGNFRGIIREIAQNRIMGRYLTFEGNKKHKNGVYPDENFARELMQLFTIGLYELNMDGTAKTNPETGAPIPSYDNSDVVAFARIWTGWSAQNSGSGPGGSRGNIQGLNGNYIDPMKLTSANRDTYPKTSLGGGYLGDGYPLCNEQPPRAFLLRGARYHKIGSKSSLKLTYAVDEEDKPIGEFANEAQGFGGKIREHFQPDPASHLYQAICSRNGTASCTFPVDVYLPATIPCTGKVECGADILHVVKMVEGDRYEFYKYIEPLCVDLQFFSGGKTMKYGSQDQCADPRTPMRAGVACCKPVSKPPLQYPVVNGAPIELIINGNPALHRDNLYKINLQSTGVHSGGASANDGPYAFKFPGRSARLFVTSIVRWAYSGNLFIFIPGYGITLEDLSTFFANTNGMKMVVELWDDTDTPAPVASNAGGDQCLYLAEPMTFATAEQRCHALNGSHVCADYQQTSAEDGSSTDWLQTCAGFQYDWTNTDCNWRVNIHKDGSISIADYTDATGDWFRVQWSTPALSSTSNQIFPHPDNNNCGESSTPSYVKVADKAKCGLSSETVIGMINTTQNCAARCSENGAWDWFTYGRNDSWPNRCRAGQGCECRCTKRLKTGTMTSNTQDRCARIQSDSTDLYKLSRRCKHLPGKGGSCLCDIDVETTAVYTDATKKPPTVAELRSALHMAASPPGDFGSGVYTQCTTAVCMSQDGVVVHVKGTSPSPSGFDADTIFEITSAIPGRPGPKWAKYLLNRKSIVYVGPTRHGGVAFSFRNAPTFNPSQGVRMETNSPFNSEDFTEARAQYETTALIDHLFEHPNTAPFVAYRLIQRLVTSNPSPRYMEAVATAFATGTYRGKTYPSGYGDMQATVAAILLDREARASILDLDPKHGQLREPLIKVFHMLRAMDFKTENDLELGLHALYAKLGQEPFKPRTVFSFFTPHYSPEGPVADAGLVAPEGMLSSSPWTIGYLSGMAALASNGVSNTDGGFGDGSRNQGRMHFKPSNPANVAASVDELAVVLTAGRLSNSSRKIIEAAYANALSLGANGGWYNMSNATATMGPVLPYGANVKYSAIAAIDDYKGPVYGQGCATATATDDMVAAGDLPYWQVDLKRRVKVTHLKITPRGAAQSQMIWGIDIEVDGVVCASNLNTSAMFNGHHIPCGLIGQVVRIVKRNGDRKHLQISDVSILYGRFPIAPGIYESGSTFAAAESAAMREALTLFSIIPEYHVTNLNIRRNNTLRVAPPPQVSQNRPYKAVIATHLIGGVDSFNILVPLDGCTKPVAGSTNGQREAFDLHAEYKAVRKDELALPSSQLNPITVPAGNKQPCTRFGITKKLPILHTLYNDGDAAFIANMGAMVEPLNKHNKKHKKQPAGNYGHNLMTQHSLAVNAGDLEAKGVIGRMVNYLMRDRNGNKAYKSQMYSLQGATKILEGAPGTPVHLTAGSGVVRYPKFAQYAQDIANMSKYKTKSIFGEHYIQTLHDHLKTTEELGDKMAAELQTTFTGSLGLQYEQVAKAIRMDTNLLSMERAGFFTSHHGYDTHGSMNQDTLFNELNSAITSLVSNLKQQGLWDNTVIVFVSDFGRTLTSNSQGTDHGWGGNYFVLGGKVRGGQVLGKFPDRLDPIVSDENDGRGRIIPTTPWESVWNGIADWFGVDQEGRDAILPIKKNFDNSTIFSVGQLFES